MDDMSIFDDLPDLEYKKTIIKDEFQIRAEVKIELRQEFYNVYVKNELFYQNYIKNLLLVIKEKDKQIELLSNFN
jgi:hypothetical protein